MSRPEETARDWFDRLADTQFRIVCGVIGVALFAAVFPLRSCGQGTLPNPPPRPKEIASLASAEKSVRKFERQEAVYSQAIARDSKIYGVVPAANLETISKVLPYVVDRSIRLLKPGEKNAISAAGLRLSLEIRRTKGVRENQMVLLIHNPTTAYLAYKIDTRPTKGTTPCSKKRSLPYNGMSVAPGKTEARVECIHRRGWGLEIRKVETVQVPALSHHYLSRVPPKALGVDRRVAEGHETPDGRKACQVFFPSEVKRAIADKNIGWRDLVDYYARHSCDTYAFSKGYVAWTQDKQASLPVGNP